MKLIIEADGGSRGNPGISGAGAVVIDAESGQLLREISVPVGIATNNVAEYSALVFGLEAAFDLDPAAEIVVRMDSKLVVEQMSGRWKIKHPDMLSLGKRVQKLILGKNVSFNWIPREQNTLADALANKAMDGEPPAAAASVEFNQVAQSSIRAPQSSITEVTTLVLVRHGRTALTETRRISGGDGDNPDLSELGNKDAADVAQEISRFGLSGAFGFLTKPVAVIHSPVKRAVQTATKIARALDVEQIELENLREIGFGDWDGLTNEELFVAHEEQYQKWRGSYEIAPPNGESLKDFDVRVNSSLNFFLEKFAGKTVVVVAHVMPIRGLLRIANDASSAGFWRVDLGPASISIARFWGREGAEVVCVNSTSHLSS